MADEIINKVSQSKLITIDLEDYYPSGQRILLDIKNWLFEELILREKDFRSQLNEYDWEQYKNTYVALTCSADAIIPSWAYLLITTKLSPFAKKVIVGDLVTLETSIYQEIINTLPINDYKGAPIIIKGCANKPIPPTAYTQLITKIQPIARSVMYGEACSTVPLFKKRN